MAAPVSFRSTIAHPPRRELVLATLLDGCVVGHRWSPWKPSHQPSSRQPSLLTTRALCRATGRAGPGRVLSSLDRIGCTHCACGPTMPVLAHGQCFK
jgi:hypothetical protein